MIDQIHQYSMVGQSFVFSCVFVRNWTTKPSAVIISFHAFSGVSVIQKKIYESSILHLISYFRWNLEENVGNLLILFLPLVSPVYSLSVESWRRSFFRYGIKINFIIYQFQSVLEVHTYFSSH